MESSEGEKATPPAQFRLLRPVTALPGTLFDFQQAVIVAIIETSGFQPTQLLKLNEALTTQFAKALAGKQVTGAKDVLHTILRWILHLQRAHNHPLFDSGCIQVLSEKHPPAYMLVAPYFHAQSAERLLGHVLAVCQAILRGEAIDSKSLIRSAEVAQKHLQANGIKSLNTVHYLQAAHSLRIPWEHISDHIFRIGQARYGRFLRDSSSDQTSSIGLSLARSKAATAELLARAGFPVPPQRIVSSVDQSLLAAAQLGYPVVVKPLSEDGGYGVTAGISTESEVVQACNKLPPRTRSFLVEKHIEGRDHRITVINGKVAWVVERTPAGVSGDGNSSISQLIERENASPLRSSSPDTPLYPIVIDAELIQMLQKKGMSIHSIPERGEFVRLRSITNINVGGIPVAIPLATIHPANINMVERVSRLQGLDLAGVDLLIPDITRPWHQQYCAINEINGYPTMGTYTAKHLYTSIVRGLVQDTDGRIPLITVVSSATGRGSYVSKLIHKVLSARQANSALANSEGAWIDEEQIAVGDQRSFSGAGVLISARDCDRAVLEIAETDISKYGFPVNGSDISICLLQGNSSIGPTVKSFLDNVGDTLICAGEHYELFKNQPPNPDRELILITQDYSFAQQHITGCGATLFSKEGSNLQISSDKVELTVPDMGILEAEVLFAAAALWAGTRDVEVFSQLRSLAVNPSNTTQRPRSSN